MRRRKFIMGIVGSAAAWPLALQAQQSDRMRRIGVLMNGAATELGPQSYVAAFVQSLRQLGWIEGQNVRLDVRWNAGNADLARTYAAQLIGMMPDVILVASTTNLGIMLQATHTVPIVFVQVSDPVAQGFVSNLAHPGGNVTGFSAYEFSIGGKWLDLLKQIAPKLARVAVMFNPETSPQSKLFLPAIEAAAPSFGVQVVAVPVSVNADIEQSIESFARQPNGGLILPTDSTTRLRHKLIAELAARFRLPAVSAFSEFPMEGGLMYYGNFAGLVDEYRRAASYVDRILKGAKPADLPVQAPTKYELVINLKTAKALGLKIPDKLLFTADKVIE